MIFKRKKLKSKIKSISTSISSILIPIFQYVPCTAVWRGIMSVPLIIYITLFCQNPGILIHDLRFLFSVHGTYIALIGFIFYLYALIYQLTHKKQLLYKGPYKITRHPQYLGFIIMTFGLTIVAFQTYPIVNYNPFFINGYTAIFYIWIGEVLAYLLLAKIEEYALKAKYSEVYLEYANRVSFMFPFLKLNKREIRKIKAL